MIPFNIHHVLGVWDTMDKIRPMSSDQRVSVTLSVQGSCTICDRSHSAGCAVHLSGQSNAVHPRTEQALWTGTIEGPGDSYEQLAGPSQTEQASLE